MTFLIYLLALPLALLVREIVYAIVAFPMGVRIRRVVLGAGPVIKKFYRGRMEVELATLPLFFSILFFGSNPTAQANGEQEGTGELGLFRHSYGKRLFVFLSGSVALLLLGWGILIIGGMLLPPPAPVVGGIEAYSPAEDAGLEVGDRIFSADGADVRYLFDLYKKVYQNKGNPLDIKVQRGNDVMELTITTDECFGPRGEFIPQGLGILAPSQTRVLRVLPDQPAAKGGIQGGDWIREIDGKPVELWAQVVDAITASNGEEVEIVVERAGERKTLHVKPKMQVWRSHETGAPILDAEGKPQTRAMMGAVGDLGNMHVTEASMGRAVAQATSQAIPLALSVPVRAFETFVPENNLDVGRVGDSLSIDLENGMIEARRPWYRPIAELFLLMGLFLLPYSFVQAKRGRASQIAEEDE
ncbi:MAG: PDZ domain-containing protein [Chrysiogenetes bacterium]|nr:PDZ domain-containing protein [Chrysiogenetes bacterium]